MALGLPEQGSRPPRADAGSPRHSAALSAQSAAVAVPRARASSLRAAHWSAADVTRVVGRFEVVELRGQPVDPVRRGAGSGTGPLLSASLRSPMATSSVRKAVSWVPASRRSASSTVR